MRYIVSSSAGPHGVLLSLGVAVKKARGLADGRGEAVTVGLWPSGKVIYTARPATEPRGLMRRLREKRLSRRL